MAKLSKEEAEQLKALREKEEAPDEPEDKGGGLSRVLNVSVDLGDEDQVKRAIGLGLLTEPELEELEDEGDDKDKGDEDGPRRRGYFGDDK